MKSTDRAKAIPPAPYTPNNDKPKMLRVMDVAKELNCRYQKARDLMLTGKLGRPEYDANGKLVVPEAGVKAFDAARKEKP